jgi:hypothetical protein
VEAAGYDGPVEVEVEVDPGELEHAALRRARGEDPFCLGRAPSRLRDFIAHDEPRGQEPSDVRAE